MGELVVEGRGGNNRGCKSGSSDWAKRGEVRGDRLLCSCRAGESSVSNGLLSRLRLWKRFESSSRISSSEGAPTGDCRFTCLVDDGISD
jgi:hypothetical protein